MLAELAKKNTKKKANKRPAGGLYGYTKSTQRDVLASVRKVQKSANRIAKALYAKDNKTFNFLHTHAERSKSLSARILCAAMENIGPKVASTKTAAMRTPTHSKADKLLAATFDIMAANYVTEVQKHLGDDYGAFLHDLKTGRGIMDLHDFALGNIKNMHKGLQPAGMADTFKEVSRRLESFVGKQWKLASVSPKTAAGHGMYGYRVKTAKLALQACLDISQEAGSVAYDLHTRRTAKYEKITSFLRDHSKRGRCRFARILLRFYPDAPIVTASDDDADEKEAKHEKGKSVALKDMPKELQDNAKDPSKHIKPKKKKASRMPKKSDMLNKNSKSFGEFRTWCKDEGIKPKKDDAVKEALQSWLGVQGGSKSNTEIKNYSKADIADIRGMLRLASEDIKASEIEDLNMQVLAALEAGDMDADEKQALFEKAKKVYNTLTKATKAAGGCDSPKLPEALKAQCKKKQEEGSDSDDSESEDKDKKEASGSENLPPPLKKNCESGPPGAKKKDDGDDDDSDSDDGDKKASRVRLTTRVANGELQRGQVKFAADDEEDESDEKEGESLGRSQLPGEGDSNQNQPKLEGNSGYNPGSTELNGQTGAPKAAAEDSELAAKAEGHSELPNDEESNKVQPDMKDHGFEVGGVKTKTSGETVTYTTTTTHLPDGATLIWVE